MGRSVCLIEKSVKSAEQLAVCHVMTVNNRIFVRKIGRIPAVEEDAAGKGKLPVWIPVEKGQVVAALHYRVINGRAVDGQPADHFVCDWRIFRIE